MNVLEMMKQAASMRKGLKQMQKELARKTVEGRSAGGEVTVKARGDMTIESVRIDPTALNPAQARHLEQSTAAAINAALESARKMAAAEVSKIGAEHGLPGLNDLL